MKSPQDFLKETSRHEPNVCGLTISVIPAPFVSCLSKEIYFSDILQINKMMLDYFSRASLVTMTSFAGTIHLLHRVFRNSRCPACAVHQLGRFNVCKSKRRVELPRKFGRDVSYSQREMFPPPE